MLSRFFVLTMFPVCAFTPPSRPAEGRLRRCLVVGRHLGGRSRAQKARGVPPGWLGAEAARRRPRVDAALSPGVTIPDPQGLRSRSLARSQGAPPGLRTASPVLPALVRERSARQRLRLIRAEARGRRPRRRGAGCRGRFRSDGGWPCPCPVLFRARPSAPRTARPPRSPLVFEGARPARPHRLGPGKGRENENACPPPKEIFVTRALRNPAPTG